MPTYLLYPEKNQNTRSSANARRNKTQKGDAETSKETLKKETECQTWTYIRLQTHTQGNRMPNLDLHLTPNR